MRAFRATRLLAFWAVLAAMAAVAQAGVITYVPLWTDTADADSGISPDKYYTHLLDFGSSPAATVNGVAFTQVQPGNVDSIPGFAYTVDTSGRNGHGGNGAHNVTGGIVDMLTDMMYNGSNAPGGVATLTFSDLVPGLEYETRVYNRQWSASPDRTAT